MSDPTPLSIDAAALNEPDQARVENELIRLLSVNLPSTIARRNSSYGWGLVAPDGYNLYPGDLTKDHINRVVLRIEENKDVFGVNGFKTLSTVTFYCVADLEPVPRDMKQKARRIAKCIMEVLSGTDVSGNPVRFGWHDEDSYRLWAELVPDPQGINPFRENKIFSYTAVLQMSQYVHSNGMTQDL